MEKNKITISCHSSKSLLSNQILENGTSADLIHLISKDPTIEDLVLDIVDNSGNHFQLVFNRSKNLISWKEVS